MANYIGFGHVEGAYGPVITIPRDQLDGCRLILKASSGVRFESFGDIKHAVEHFGCGLRLIKTWETDKNHMEAILEPMTNIEQKEIYLYGEKRMPPADTYVLATDFKGDVNIHLYKEQVDGKRVFYFGMSPAYDVYYK